jgi:hypothetical protein
MNKEETYSWETDLMTKTSQLLITPLRLLSNITPMYYKNHSQNKNLKKKVVLFRTRKIKFSLSLLDQKKKLFSLTIPTLLFSAHLLKLLLSLNKHYLSQILELFRQCRLLWVTWEKIIRKIKSFASLPSTHYLPIVLFTKIWTFS